jgi:hypothetical protein
VVIVAEHAHLTMLVFGVDVVAIPLDDVVLVHLAEEVESVNLVLYYLLSRATFKILIPSFLNGLTSFSRLVKHAMMRWKWLDICIVQGATAQND